VLGTERVRRGWRIRPRKVSLRFGRPMTFPRSERRTSQEPGRFNPDTHSAGHYGF